MKRGLLALACALAVAAPTSVVVASPSSPPKASVTAAPTGLQAASSARVTQRGRITVYPPIVQNARGVRSASDADILGVATFRPAQKGRHVLIQRRLRGGSWKAVTRKRENRSGVVRFAAADTRRGRTYIYRAVAVRSGGLRKLATTGQSSTAWKMKFSDQFNGRRLNRQNWRYRDLGELKGLRLHAQSSRKAVHVGQGRLELQVRRNRARSRRYFLNGHIGSQDKFSFRYGITAARVKFEKGKGQHGSFWLQPQSKDAPFGKPAQTGAEIDVAEFFGKGYHNGGMAHFVYYYPRENQTVKSGGVMKSANAALRGRSDRWWTRYHVFSVQWTPKRYVFRIDGVETWSTTRGVSHQRQFLILSLLTSDYELPKLDKSTLPTSMQIDWVRAWQR